MSALHTPGLQMLAAGVFALALLHTFCTPFFARRAQRHSRHAGLWHLLAEVELVFGLWALLLMVLCMLWVGQAQTLQYLGSRQFTEALFVLSIMLIAGSQPVLSGVRWLVLWLGARLSAGLSRWGWGRALGPVTVLYALLLSLLPLLGSFITEPAAMTLAALLLRETVFAQPSSERLKYVTLGVLLVNVSIGGTLTTFAAPPVLMVAQTWQWDAAFMLQTFGGKAALAVCTNALLASWLLRRELASMPLPPLAQQCNGPVTALHLLLLALVVVFAHHPVVFLALLLVFLGGAQAYPQHHPRLFVGEALRVAVFLAGLVVLGGLQQWWLQPLLTGLSANAVFYAALLLTAFTDNAALTYLASLVPGLSAEFKVALVAGAVTGGGLTLVANAPNPVAAALLKAHFPQHTIAPLPLLLAALVPTGVAALLLR